MSEFSFKEIAENGKLKKFLPFILIGGAVGLFAFMTKGKSQDVSIDESGVGANVGGLLQDYSQKTEQALNQNIQTTANLLTSMQNDLIQQKEENSLLEDNILNMLDTQNRTISEFKDSMSYLIEQQKTTTEEQISAVKSQIQNTNVVEKSHEEIIKVIQETKPTTYDSIVKSEPKKTSTKKKSTVKKDPEIVTVNSKEYGTFTYDKNSSGSATSNKNVVKPDYWDASLMGSNPYK